MEREEKSFVVDAIVAFLRFCERFTFAHWIVRWFKIPESTSWRFVDKWVLIWCAASILAFALVSAFDLGVYARWLIAAPSILRVIELTIAVLQSLTGSLHPRKDERYLSYRRSIFLVMSNYVETIFWFATWYTMMGAPYLQVSVPLKTLLILRESLMSMVANSTGSLVFTSSWSLSVNILHSALGLFLTTVVVARIVSLLPPPGSHDVKDQPRPTPPEVKRKGVRRARHRQRAPRA